MLGFNRKKWDSNDSTTSDSGNDNYNNISWKELPKKVQKAARTLGYTETMWNNDEDSPLDDKGWSELTSEERKAAKLIGYDQRRWDEGSDAVPSYDHLDWADLPNAVKAAAKHLKFSQSIWDNDEKSPLDDKDWDELTHKQQEAAKVLGKNLTCGFLKNVACIIFSDCLSSNPFVQAMTKRNGIMMAQMTAKAKLKASKTRMNH